MKHIWAWTLVLVAGGALYVAQTATTNHDERRPQEKTASQRSAAELEKSIEMNFLRYGSEGEVVSTKERIEQLGTRDEVSAVLRRMIAKYRYARERSPELRYLIGATYILGELQDKQAQDGLLLLVSDRRVDESVRAMAVRSLGKIDAEANKGVLLKALRAEPDNDLMKIYAAEGLSKIADPQVGAALDEAVRQEKDIHLREMLRQAAKTGRAKQ